MSPAVLPTPASLPSHTPITNTTHSNSVLYRTVSTLEKKVYIKIEKLSHVFCIVLYTSINLKQTV